MFDLKNKYTNISAFEIFDKYLYVLSGKSSKEKNVKCIIDNIENELISNKTVFSIKVCCNDLWVISSGKTIGFTNQIFQKEYLNFIYKKSVEIRTSQYLFERISGNGEREFCLLDISDDKIIWEIGMSSTLFFSDQENLILIQFGENIEKKRIICFSYSKKKKVWVFDLTNLLQSQISNGKISGINWEVKKIVGVADYKIWIALNHHTVTALDIETGKLIYQLSDIASFKSEWLPSAIPMPEAIILDEKQNILIGLAWEFYWEIDPTSGGITFFDLTKEFTQLQIRNDLNHYVLDDEHIYFASRNESKLGAFNRVTKKIDWQYTLEGQGEIMEIPLIKEIKGNHKILAALDLAGTLHFFRKNYQQKKLVS